MDILKIIEWLGFITGVAAVFTLAQKNILTWPISIINTLLSIILFYKTNLFGDFFTQIVLLIMSIWGWHQWLLKINTKNQLPISFMTINNFVKMAFILILFWAIVFYVFYNFLPCSYPFWEAGIFVLSMFGIYLTALSKIESWPIWLIADSIMIGVYLAKGLNIICLYVVVVMIIGIWGWMQWYKEIKNGKNNFEIK